MCDLQLGAYDTPLSLGACHGFVCLLLYKLDTFYQHLHISLATFLFVLIFFA